MKGTDLSEMYSKKSSYGMYCLKSNCQKWPEKIEASCYGPAYGQADSLEFLQPKIV